MRDDNDISKPLSSDQEESAKEQTIKPLSSDQNISEEEQTAEPCLFDQEESAKEPTTIPSSDEKHDDTQSSLDENTNVRLIPGVIDDIGNKESNFVFYFGVSGSGKTVILAAMLYYFGTQAGTLGAKLDSLNTKEASVLLHELYKCLENGVFPDRTTVHDITRLDLVFRPNNKSKKVTPINLTFLETAGSNHLAITKGGAYHSSIVRYLRANIPLHVIIITSCETAANDDVLIDEFFRILEENGKDLTSLNVILVISQWDKYTLRKSTGSNKKDTDEFIKNNLHLTNQLINTYQLSKTCFTIGNVIKITTAGKEKEKIDPVNLTSAEVLAKWLYKSIVGISLDYEGTFWERIKFSIFP